MPNLVLRPKTNLSSFRKIALGTWKTVGDPSVYGSLDIDASEVVRYIDEFREKTGKRLTITHMLAKVMGAVYTKMPDANAILRWGRIYQRRDIGVFFQVALEDEETGEIDLSGATIHHPEQKSLVNIMDEFQATVDKVRKKKDEKLEQSRGLFKKLPFFALRIALNFVSFVAYTLNLDPGFLNVPKDAFGSVMITNIGSLGLQEAYVPLVPYSRVPLLLAVGAIQDKAVVKDGELVPGKVLHISATFDHRILDGAHAAVMSKVLRQWMEHPYDHFDDIDAIVAGQGGSGEPKSLPEGEAATESAEATAES